MQWQRIWGGGQGGLSTPHFIGSAPPPPKKIMGLSEYSLKLCILNVVFKMAKRQATLFSILSAPITKKAREENDCDIEEGTDEQEDNEQSDLLCEELRDEESSITMEEQNDTPSENVSTNPGYSSQCCTSEEKAFQPNDKPTLQLLGAKGRNFQPTWYKQFPWLTVCICRMKVFCLYCRYAAKHNWFTFCITGENVFTEKGFHWKKAIEKYKTHEGSLSQGGNNEMAGSRKTYN